jgi:hypothetical protein
MTQSGHRGRKVLVFNIAGVVLAGTLATAEFITLRGATMHRTILTTICLLVLATASSPGGDLPTRYAPPPVINGGPGTKVGVLDCRLAPSIGLIVVEFQNMECRFIPERGGPFEAYEGRMSTIGGALGFTASGALTWGVFAPTNNMVPGSLAGSYVGASANAGFIVGVGGNFLLGGSGNTVALQPWSVEGTTGVNASAGLSNLELRPKLPRL